MLVTLRGKTGWREVEMGRGSSDATCPVAAVKTWVKFSRLAHGALFRRVAGQGKAVGADRLNGKEVARLVKRAAMAACAAISVRSSGRESYLATHCSQVLLPPPKLTNVSSRSNSGMPLPN
jgi:hypothetical protein